MSEQLQLSYGKCLELLTGGVVGRVGLCTPGGPRIVPVNYSVVDDAVVFRTQPYSLLGTYAWNTNLAFEVDHIEYDTHRAWSVVALGRGSMVEDETELAAIRAFWDPRPWVSGPRLVYVKLRWDTLTGRRLGAGWTHDNEMPVRRTV